MNKIILDGQIINYSVERKNIKNFYFRIKNNLVFISAPKSADLDYLEALLKKHKRFIIKRINEAKISIYNRNELKLWGENLDVKVISSLETMDNSLIEKFYCEQTIEKARTLLVELEEEIDFLKKKEISLKSQLMKSRLGSCNIKTKKINLNSILARFEPVYLRAVLIHEIMHLEVANHQKAFYDLLLKYEPEYKQIKARLNKLLKNYQI